MPNSRCERCRQPMPLLARSHARFCSGRCRVAAHRARRTVPAELTARPRWVRRSAAKVPLTVGGAVASSTDASTWSRHGEAVASPAGVGLGFVLNGDGVVCVDLDHCLGASGELLPWARRLLELTGATWVERSVSGEGLHIWGRGRLPHGRRITVDGGSVEIYGDGRYIAVTGRTWGDTPRHLGDLSHLIDSLL